MVWTRLLLTLALVLPAAAHPSSAGCTQIEIGAGLCGSASAKVNGNEVDLSASASRPNSNPSSRGGPPSQTQGSPPPLPVRGLNCVIAPYDRTDPRCTPAPPATSAPPGPKGTPAVTLADIATFRPAPGTDHMEPDGWAVAGLDTNFYALAPQQIVPGTLLGRPAEVRFTAVGFHWDYGDGTGAARGTPGGTWDQLRIAEFDPTPTSHVYAAEGDYTIHLRIDYRAEYRFDGPDFVSIVGIIALPANDLTITVGDATTVLVNHDCSAQPSGPGC